MSREGGCFCGAVRYELLKDPMFVQCCHCLDCQKQTGGAFAINALIETKYINLTKGSPTSTAMPTESGHPHDIWRCGDCQTALWSDYGGRAYLRFLRVATLDEPHAIEPAVHIFTRSKVRWVHLPENARMFPVYYEIDKEWPAESLQRRAQMREEARRSV
ncbi:MAG TPA: GFA family protein [Rhizomicrobium sp.]|nr:GFA family protein [Rhizomicrobium sp.]